MEGLKVDVGAEKFADGGNVGSKISEIKAKIAKAKANAIMPEALK